MAALAAADVKVPAWPAVSLPHTQQHEMASRHTGRSYRIFVSVPAQPAPPLGYPVLYLLDGNAYFPVAHTLAQNAARVGPREHGKGFVAPIVVAIGYPTDGLLDSAARSEDYTPPAPDLTDSGDRMSVKQGGADRFLDFIEGELKPLIEARLPIDRSRQTLAGHSYGGLLALHALFTQPEGFQRYVAGSPSIWWNQRYVLKEKQKFLDNAKKPSDLRVLIMVGDQEQSADVAAVGNERAAMLVERRMVDNARELGAALASAPGKKVATHFRILPGEAHNSAALPMVIAAVDAAVAP